MRLRIFFLIIFIPVLASVIEADTLLIENDAQPPKKSSNSTVTTVEDIPGVDEAAVILAEQQARTERLLGTLTARVQSEEIQTNTFLEGIRLMNQSVSSYASQVQELRQENSRLESTIEKNEALLSGLREDMKWFQIKMTVGIIVLVIFLWALKTLVFKFRHGRKFPHIKRKMQESSFIYFGEPDITKAKRSL